MLDLDERLTEMSSSGSVVVVVVVAALLGLRHATDPDHMAAVATLVATSREHVARRAAVLGAFWGLGHALTLVVFGLPIVLFERHLPEPVQRGAETAVGGVIVFLAIRLLIRWRSGYFHTHAHPHRPEHQHHRHEVRSRAGAFALGLVHGLGGSAGVGVLILATIPSPALAVPSLVVLALFTAMSMTAVTSGFGRVFANHGAGRVVGVPWFGVASLAFGIWYSMAAWRLAPYPF